MELHLGYLYPHSMNTYGDTGNVLCLQQRCSWRGITLVIHEIEIGAPIPKEIDLYFFGGGQDAAQEAISADLFTKQERIRTDFEKNIPLLAICGGYQLLGESYQPFKADPIPGLGIFPVITSASASRLIGNVVIASNPLFGFKTHPTLVGFENHSGKTTFTNTEASPLGTILKGSGNNGEDHTEGCLTRNAIGSYLHGPLLPKNPHLADWILEKSLKNKISPLDDTLEWRAHTEIVERYT